MKTLKEYLDEAREKKVAIGHFGFGTMAMLHGIMEAALEASQALDHPFEGGKIPIILGASEGDREVFGSDEAVVITKLLREKHDYPVFLNADHTHDVEVVKAAIDAGYDMVIIDAVVDSYEENVRKTKEVVDYRNEIGLDCVVEAEFGFIASGSDMKDELPEGIGPEAMTDPALLKKFVEVTGIEAVAPSVGNVHGMVKSGNPKLDIDRIKALCEATDAHLVLHGGSGISDEDFVRAIKAGISCIHISTEIRKVYREAIEEDFEETESVSPTKYLPDAQEAVKQLVKERIKLFLEN